MTGALLYGRRARVIVGSEELNRGPQLAGDARRGFEIASEGEHGLRLSFKVKRSLKREQNTAEVQIYNLTEQTRALFGSRERQLLLEAGYVDGVGVLFTADWVRVGHSRQGPDWVTSIEAADGVQPFSARVSGSHASGVTGKEILDGIIRALKKKGLDLFAGDAEIAEALGAVRYDGGYVYSDTAGNVLARITAEAGIEISVQDGKFLFLKEGDATRAKGILLTPETGLIGSPELFLDPQRPKAHLIKGKSLLMAGIVPGRRLELKTRSQSGTFRVEAVEHTGDTHGGDESWTSEWEAKAI